MNDYLYKLSYSFYSFARSHLSSNVAQNIRKELYNNYYLNGNKIFPVTKQKLFSEINEVLATQKKECHMALLNPNIPDNIAAGYYFYLTIKFVGYEDDIYIPLNSHRLRVNVLDMDKNKMVVDVKLVAKD